MCALIFLIHLYMFWGRQHLKYSFLVQHILRLSRMRKEMYATCCGTVEERDINNEQRKKYDFCRLTLNHYKNCEYLAVFSNAPWLHIILNLLISFRLAVLVIICKILIVLTTCKIIVTCNSLRPRYHYLF